MNIGTWTSSFCGSNGIEATPASPEYCCNAADTIYWRGTSSGAAGCSDLGIMGALYVPLGKVQPVRRLAMTKVAQARVRHGGTADFVGPSDRHATLEARPRSVPVAVELSQSRPFRLSAVVATFQGERFLREQLRSMLAQSVALDEIVITDDCSGDSTLAIVEDAKAESSIPIQILRGHRRLGVGKNFERGLRASTGDIVFLADQDDNWRPDKVARMLNEFMLRPTLDVLFTDARLVDEVGASLDDTLFQVLRVARTERRRVRDGRAFDALLRRNLATGATMAVRRASMLRALPIPDGWLHDEWIAMIVSASGRVDFLDETLTDYRQHDNNHVGSRRETFRSVLKKLRCCRREFNCRLMRRTEMQIERLRALSPPVAERQIALASLKLEHLRHRCRLPTRRLARMPLIARELVNGGYRHYSSGLRSIVGDLFGAMCAKCRNGN
jgi:glycosyltransferase involved in cell wall biosynthesis